MGVLHALAHMQQLGPLPACSGGTGSVHRDAHIIAARTQSRVVRALALQTCRLSPLSTYH
eukprot:7691889-Alexandrium_andersonii.AAC.1